MPSRLLPPRALPLVLAVVAALATPLAAGAAHAEGPAAYIDMSIDVPIRHVTRDETVEVTFRVEVTGASTYEHSAFCGDLNPNAADASRVIISNGRRSVNVPLFEPMDTGAAPPPAPRTLTGRWTASTRSIGRWTVTAVVLKSTNTPAATAHPAGKSFDIVGREQPVLQLRMPTRPVAPGSILYITGRVVGGNSHQPLPGTRLSLDAPVCSDYDATADGRPRSAVAESGGYFRFRLPNFQQPAPIDIVVATRPLNGRGDFALDAKERERLVTTFAIKLGPYVAQPLQVTARPESTTAQRGAPVRVQVSVAPNRTGESIRVYRLVSGQWQRVSFSAADYCECRLDTNSRVAFTLRPPGRSIYRVANSPTRVSKQSFSDPFTITVTGS